MLHTGVNGRTSLYTVNLLFSCLGWKGVNISWGNTWPMERWKPVIICPHLLFLRWMLSSWLLQCPSGAKLQWPTDSSLSLFYSLQPSTSVLQNCLSTSSCMKQKADFFKRVPSTSVWFVLLDTKSMLWYIILRVKNLSYMSTTVS